MKGNFVSQFLANTGFIVVNKLSIKKIGLNPTVLLGELCSEYNYYANTEKLVIADEKEWFYSTIANIEENTGLSRFQQEAAIQILINKDILNTKIMGMPSRKYYNINYDELEKLLKKDESDVKVKQNTPKMAKNQGCEKLTTKDASNSQSRMQETDNQGCEKMTTKDASFQHSYIPVNNNKTIINKNNNLISSNNEPVENESAYPFLEYLLDEKRKKHDNPVLLNGYKNKQKFLKNIEFDEKISNFSSDEISSNEKNKIYNILVDQASEILMSSKNYYNISGEKVNTVDFINYILSLNKNDISEMTEKIYENKNKARNIRQYIIATIYNQSRYKDINKINKKMTRDEYNDWFRKKFLNI